MAELFHEEMRHPQVLTPGLASSHQCDAIPPVQISNHSHMSPLIGVMEVSGPIVEELVKG